MSLVAMARSTAFAVTSLLDRLDSIPKLVARLIIGGEFILTGYGKVTHLEQVTQNFTEWGIPLPALNASLASFTELVGGALVLVGLFTRLASVPLIVTMIVATLSVKIKEKDFEGIASLPGLVEITYIGLLLWLVFSGPGVASLDRLLFGRWSAATSPRERLAPS